jgi:hypothetical protein
MSLDWYDIRAPPIEACQHGVAVADVSEVNYTGPRTFENIDYPAGEVLPQQTSRTAGNEFQHDIFVNLYFERGRDTEYLDVLHHVSSVISEVMGALSNTEDVISFVPAVIEDFAGELDDTLILLVSTRFEITTVVEMADT